LFVDFGCSLIPVLLLIVGEVTDFGAGVLLLEEIGIYF
jgi:hypothetical protein